MTLAIASGKGGTGKTTLSVNLARALGTDVQLLDCDVEEPNAHLFLGGSVRQSTIIAVPVPAIDESRCDGCGACSAVCVYGAIVTVGRTVIQFPELCHGCGGCMRVCPRGAIRETHHRIGVVEERETGRISLIQGRLDIGSTHAPALIRELRTHARAGVPTIVDAPPGTSCPVVTSLRGADRVVLVTEPTPFGLHDLTLAVDMLRFLALPFGVVVNRMGIGDDRVHAYCHDQGIPLLLEIPDDRRIAEAYAHGKVLIDALPEYRLLFERLIEETLLMEKTV